MRTAFLLLFLGLAGGAMAQHDEPERVIVNYRDGSTFVGEIVERHETELFLLLSTGDKVRLMRSDIKRIRSTNDWMIYTKGSYHLKKGYFGYMSLSYGEDSEFQINSQANFIIGKRLNEKWSVGIGNGFVGTDAQIGGDWVMHQFYTLYGYGRYYLKNAKVRPYVDAGLGYGFNSGSGFLVETHSGGLNITPGVGLHFATRTSVRWHVGLSRYIQYTSGDMSSIGPFGNPVDTQYRLWYHRMVFRVGIEIK